ncbi:hypothetical protein SAMN05421823_104108 [Catalinimonas alkaloidigena]|uniref:Uncharacterized protein n=2 Tax=Catalinimonas alkaloidigena TaxID=1075417 RepID=A0A1G9GHD9_9BACT|nr:hypothetical protein SAMN05421823_104108 [Catalinimonas alkaloidigena]
MLLPLTILRAQPTLTHGLRTDVGLAFTGSGDLYGTSVSAEYQHRFIDHLYGGVGGRALYFPGRSSSAYAFSGEATLYAVLAPRSPVSVQLGVGTYVRHFTFMAQRFFQITPYYDAGETEREWGVGYTVKPELVIRPLPWLAFHTGPMLQNDTQGNIVWVMSIGSTARF